jgi:hypothetical protein
MSLMTRPVAGESLRSHVGARLEAPPICVGGDLLARLGLGNPWSGDSHVDSRAKARADREQRLEARLERMDRAPLRAARRMWPGESRKPWAMGSFWLSEGDLVFPLMPLEEEAEEEVEAAAGRPRRKGPRGPTMRPVSKAWHTFEHAPARVIRGSSSRSGERTARVRRGGQERFEPAPRVSRVASAVPAPASVVGQGPAVAGPDQRVVELVQT